MSIPVTPRRRRRFPGLWALTLAAAALAGCIMIPVDYHQVGARHNINTQTPNRLTPGVTTKDDVLFTYGEPDFASEDGRRLGYAWTKVKMLVLYGAYGSGGAAEFERSYVVEVSFDEADRVIEARLLKEWGSAVTPSRELSPEADAAR